MSQSSHFSYYQIDYHVSRLMITFTPAGTSTGSKHLNLPLSSKFFENHSNHRTTDTRALALYLRNSKFTGLPLNYLCYYLRLGASGGFYLLCPITSGFKRALPTVTPSIRFEDSAFSIRAVSRSVFNTCGDCLAYNSCLPLCSAMEFISQTGPKGNLTSSLLNEFILASFASPCIP